MTLTVQGMRSLREMTGMSMWDIRRAARVAEERFGGDLLAGIGHVHCSALAVSRRNPEAALDREAREFAEARRHLPEWQAILAASAEPEPPAAPSRR